jgi:hypothetical protein
LTAESSGRRLRRIPTRVLWLTATLVLAASLWVCDMASGPGVLDAPFFLQVLDRISAGDALYDDHFYGVMPLALWAALPGALLVGSQIAVLKGLCALASAAAATCATFAAARLRVGVAGQALVGTASVAYLVIPSATPWSQMAYAAQVGALAAMASWLRADPGRPARAALFLAGTAVGVSVASKQTVGALTLLACLVVVALARAGKDGSARARLRDSGVLAMPAIAIPALTLLPVAIAGDLGAFWRYAINKGEYVSHGSASYLDQFKVLGDLWGLPPEHLAAFLVHLYVLIAPLALFGLAATVRRRGDWLLLAAFTVVAIASSYPRPNLVASVPVSAVAIAWSARQLAGSRLSPVSARLALTATGLLLIPTVYAALLLPGRAAIEDGWTISHVDHFDGILAPPEFDRAAAAIHTGLTTADGGQDRTFVLSPEAGFDYLVSGVRNPTRHDFPLATAFRDGDVAELEGQIQTGQIARVCLGSFGGSPLTPRALVDWVGSQLSRAERIGPVADSSVGYLGCTMYRSPAGN